MEIVHLDGGFSVNIYVLYHLVYGLGQWNIVAQHQNAPIRIELSQVFGAAGQDQGLTATSNTAQQAVLITNGFGQILLMQVHYLHITQRKKNLFLIHLRLGYPGSANAHFREQVVADEADLFVIQDFTGGEFDGKHVLDFRQQFIS